MVYRIVDTNTSDLRHLASVDVKFSGAHIGGGIYFSANHVPTPGGSSTAIPARSLAGETELHATTEYDYTMPSDTSLWANYMEDLDGDGSADYVMAGYDMSLHVGDRLTSTGTFYDGPTMPLLIANDPNDLAGDVMVTGYPNAEFSDNMTAGYLHETTGTLTTASYTQQIVGSNLGGYFTITGPEVYNGMSGGPVYLDYDVNGDGQVESFIIGSVARAGVMDPPGPAFDYLIEATAFSPHYADLAATIDGLSGADARVADDFARMTLLSAQTSGSSLTTVQGQFFNEDIYGGTNDDTLIAAGGDDSVFGGIGADSISGGDGSDWISAGVGSDTISTGAGADWIDISGQTLRDQDTITDFDVPGGDILDLSAEFTSFSDALAASSDQPDGSVLINLPSGGMVKLLNTSVSDLTYTSLNVVCFVEGTQIETVVGPRAVEALRIGDLVKTRGGAFARVCALRERVLSVDDLKQRPNLWPVRIEAGALGPGCPSKTLKVSPQHRILIDSPISGRMADGPVFVPATLLLPINGVTQDEPKSAMTYVHIVCQQHEIVNANGCWSESFYPGKQALAALPHQDAARYRVIFGRQDHVPTAAPCLKGPKARRMIWRHVKNGVALQRSSEKRAIKLNAAVAG